MPKPSGVIKPRAIPTPKPTVTQVPIPKAAPKPTITNYGVAVPVIRKQPPAPKESPKWAQPQKPNPGDNKTPPKGILTDINRGTVIIETEKDFVFKEIPLEDGSILKFPKKKRTY